MGALAVGLLVIGTSAFGQEIRFYPLRTAPIGSAPGTIGSPVTPALVGGAWDVAFNAGGVEVDITIEGGGWGNAAGAPNLGAIQATVDSTGYSNGLGCDLSPKGWPGSPGDGAYQAKNACGITGDGSPCTPPFDATCGGGTNGVCIPSDYWIFTPAMVANDLAAIAFPTLDYGFATAAQNTLNTTDPDPATPRFGTFGGLIVDVPACAAGTYLICPNPDPNSSFMTADTGAPIAGVAFTCASITITTGKCCSSIGPAVVCEDGLTEGDCNLRPGPRTFTPNDTCNGPLPADDCPSCLSNADCDDGDACTDDTCDNFVCFYTPNYDPLVDCCNPADGSLTPIDDGDVCTDDSCNPDGTVDHTCNTAPCDDGFACTVDDVCDGACGCFGTDVNTIPCTSDADCPLGECNVASGLCECSEDTPLTCTVSGGAAPDPNCFSDGEAVQVAVGIGAGSEIVYGGQFLLGYAADCLDFAGLGACPGTTFDWIIEYEVDEATGTIWYAVTTDPVAPVGSPGPEDILCIDFLYNGDCDGCDPSVWFMSQNPRNTILTNNTGNPVPTIWGDCKGVRGLGEITLNVPDGDQINADCGLPTAVVLWDRASATDSCDGDLAVQCIAEHTGGLPIDHLIWNGGEFPQGTSFFRCEASNSCGFTEVKVWTVDVSDNHGLHVEVHLSPQILGDNFVRAIDFQLYLDCVSAPTEICEEMVFGGPYNFHAHARAWLKVDKGNYQCITARDNLHTLRAAADVVCVDNAWEAVFKGDPLQGGNWLIGGNLDSKKAGGNANTIDILDAGVYLSIIAGTQGSTAPGANTDCDTAGAFPHGDINADGVVDSGDWTFIIENFLAASKDACCPADTGDADSYIGWTSVTAKKLVELDMGELLSGDINRDGVLDMADLQLYMEGHQPHSLYGNSGQKRGASGR